MFIQIPLLPSRTNCVWKYFNQYLSYYTNSFFKLEFITFKDRSSFYQQVVPITKFKHYCWATEIIPFTQTLMSIFNFRSRFSGQLSSVCWLSFWVVSAGTSEHYSSVGFKFVLTLIALYGCAQYSKKWKNDIPNTSIKG